MIEWRVTPGLSPYAETLAEMEARAAAIRAGDARELVWLLEHPPLYTAGTSAAPEELIEPSSNDRHAGIGRHDGLPTPSRWNPWKSSASPSQPC